MTDRADALLLTEELADSVLEGSIGQLAERVLTEPQFREYQLFAKRFRGLYQANYDGILALHTYLNPGHAAELGLYRKRDGELRAARGYFLRKLAELIEAASSSDLRADINSIGPGAYDHLMRENQ